NQIVYDAKHEDIVLLVPGDPFVATTHNVIRLTAIKQGVKVVALPAPSVINAVLASTGLHIYKMGRPVTIIKPTPSYFPSTPYHVFYENLIRGLHTLFLLDLDVEKGYAMTACEAIEILRLLEEKEKLGIIDERTPFIAVARATSPDESVKVMKLGELIDLGPPPHSLVVPGRLNPVEMEILQALTSVSEALLVDWNKRVVSLMYTNTSYNGLTNGDKGLDIDETF
ncbi:MAG: diphthine synthase, partial [Thermofilaceae archaeon]